MPSLSLSLSLRGRPRSVLSFPTDDHHDHTRGLGGDGVPSFPLPLLISAAAAHFHCPSFAKAALCIRPLLDTAVLPRSALLRTSLLFSSSRSPLAPLNGRGRRLLFALLDLLLDPPRLRIRLRRHPSSWHTNIPSRPSRSGFNRSGLSVLFALASHPSSVQLGTIRKRRKWSE